MNRQTKAKDIVYLIIMSVTLALCITLTVMLGIFGSKVAGTEKFLEEHKCMPSDNNAKPDAETQNVTVSPEPMYVLGEKEGKLTIYGPDRSTVIDILDTYVYSLPLSDREAVSDGIAVFSVNELISLIEDYTS